MNLTVICHRCEIFLPDEVSHGENLCGFSLKLGSTTRFLEATIMLSCLLRSPVPARRTSPRHWQLSCCCLAAGFFYLAGAPVAVEAQSFKVRTTPAAGSKPSAQVQVRLAPSAVVAAAATPFPLANTFKLHSRPQAALKIYLDFDGHVTQNTPWNLIGAAPPEDLDGGVLSRRRLGVLFRR